MTIYTDQLRQAIRVTSLLLEESNAELARHERGVIEMKESCARWEEILKIHQAAWAEAMADEEAGKASVAP